uniref:Uncharacterized protein n=1 Tax=Magallana gigas TaxID=29159 RepID=A0A8W8MIZ5_MAGGI
MLDEHSSEAVVSAAVPKTPSAADGVPESTKIEAIEYFKNNCTGPDEDTVIVGKSISYMSQHQDLLSPNPQQFKIGLEETGLAATIMNPAPSTSLSTRIPKEIFRETPFTPSKRKTILPVHFSSIRRSHRLMEKHASRLDTLNRRNAIQTLVPIHSTPEKARHNLDFVIVSNPRYSATFQHQLSNPYESFTEMNTEEQWHPQSDERQLEIFKLDDVGCQMTPPGIPNQVHPYMAEEDIQTLMRSLDKDVKLAQFTDECTNWWKEFLASEILGSIEETWPTLNRTTEVDPMSTLSEKELDLIEKYKEKRSQFKEVFTKEGTDRRKYKKNDMVVVKISKTKVNIGEVRSVNGEDLELNIFKRNKGCFTSTDHIVSVKLSSCFATGFQ